MYKILGTYKGTTEVVDQTNTQEDAEYMLQEYSLAFGPDWTLRIHYGDYAD